MRHQHAGLAVPDFPLAYGKLWPATDAASIVTYNQTRLEAAGEQPITAAHVVVHMIHRCTALVIAGLIFACTLAAWRRSERGNPIRKITAVWTALVIVQITLGALSVWSQRKVDVTTAHVAVGALTFLVGWLSFLVTSFRVRAIAECPSFVRNAVLAEGAELKTA
jgi:cytochrome c oxidase assembly protein subunit 15